MKCILAAAVFFAFALPVIAQKECSLTNADLPSIHGLRLGMSRNELARVYEVMPDKIVHRGPNSDIRHVENIWFDFFQDSLSKVEFDYDRGTEWNDIRHFAQVLERDLRIPLDSWVFVDTTEAVLKCRGFTVSISSVRNTLMLTDTFAQAASAARPPTRPRSAVVQP